MGIEREGRDVVTQLQNAGSIEHAITTAALVPAGYSRAQQATESLWRDIEGEFHLLSGAEVAKVIGSQSRDRSFAARVRRKGELFGVKRQNAYRYPGFQFRSDGTIHPVINQLVAVMRDGGWSDGSIILWLCSPSRAIHDGGRPVDHFEAQDLVTVAAEMMAVEW